MPPGSSLVEIDLVEEPPDGTLLRLTHTGLPSDSSNAPAMRKDGRITSNGWSRLRPAATRVRTPGVAALARSDCPQRCAATVRRRKSCQGVQTVWWSGGGFEPMAIAVSRPRMRDFI